MCLHLRVVSPSAQLLPLAWVSLLLPLLPVPAGAGAGAASAAAPASAAAIPPSLPLLCPFLLLSFPGPQLLLDIRKLPLGNVQRGFPGLVPGGWVAPPDDPERPHHLHKAGASCCGDCCPTSFCLGGAILKRHAGGHTVGPAPGPAGGAACDVDAGGGSGVDDDDGSRVAAGGSVHDG